MAKMSGVYGVLVLLAIGVALSQCALSTASTESESSVDAGMPPTSTPAAANADSEDDKPSSLASLSDDSDDLPGGVRPSTHPTTTEPSLMHSTEKGDEPDTGSVVTKPPSQASSSSPPAASSSSQTPPAHGDNVTTPKPGNATTHKPGSANTVAATGLAVLLPLILALTAH